MKPVAKTEFISFVSQPFAREGFRFVYQGHPLQCEGCALYPVCQANFEYLRRYEVVEVRDRTHACPGDFHEDPMQVVVVREVFQPITWSKKGAFLGTSLTYRPQVCDHLECPHFRICLPPNGIRKRDRFRITKIVRDVSPECKKGYDLVLCEVENLPRKTKER